MWPEFHVTWKAGRSIYRITVTNPEHQCRGVRTATLDGLPVDPRAIPLTDDGVDHDVAVVLGRERASDEQAAAGSVVRRPERRLR
jgi:hypothetical protein